MVTRIIVVSTGDHLLPNDRNVMRHRSEMKKNRKECDVVADLQSLKNERTNATGTLHWVTGVVKRRNDKQEAP